MSKNYGKNYLLNAKLNKKKKRRPFNKKTIMNRYTNLFEILILERF